MYSITMNKVDIFRADVFQVKPEENKNVEWKGLSNEEREQKVLFFIEQLSEVSGKPVENASLEMILKKIREGKLILKKDVEYDRTNQKIVKLYHLLTEDHFPYYYYRPEEQTKKEKKNARTLLFRKKI